MTFRPERYPANWKAIRAAIRLRAGNACECTGRCGSTHDTRCGAPHGATIVREARDAAVYRLHECGALCTVESCGAVKVILTVAHVDHDERNNDPSNLLALCQRCHLVMDGANNVHRKRERRAVEAGQRPLPLLAVMPENRKEASRG
ncbi:MAG: HNH endonuclease signature motif containing protein [Deltaproteobacteria bacterium]|nr:HNH endonuclease signature motif containing protein [Myxococcales bacterium]MDP3220574.1 HNH endonuclease signature motif containing protein [Deltaproteobacteria bacterium]